MCFFRAIIFLPAILTKNPCEAAPFVLSKSWHDHQSASPNSGIPHCSTGPFCTTDSKPFLLRHIGSQTHKHGSIRPPPDLRLNSRNPPPSLLSQ
mmetsp:Transcript_18757/g.38820  ORF Transcript_18757/g.38820 Transcript_18757/m.38820 type:complete len:94 (-) Transcript_18757:6264-6545(-)